MTEVVDTYSEVAGVLESVLTAEFAGDGWTDLRHDRLHESLGHQGRVIGISPERDSTAGGNALILEVEVLVQMYDQFALKVDPNQAVDPRIITNLGQRLRVAIREAAPQNTSTLWDINVVDVAYPSDPTGNKTRLEARIVARGENAAIVPIFETTG